MREKGVEGNDLLARLAADSRLATVDLSGVLAEPLSFTGAARAQVAAVVQAVDALMTPEAATYQPEPIL